MSSNEDTVNPQVFGQRYFGPMASLRILLSDRPEDITNLPTVTALPAPVLLDGNWSSAVAPPLGRPVGYVVDGTHPPIARSMGQLAATTVSSVAGTSPTMTINVASVPTQFRVTPVAATPNISVGGQMVACTGKTQNTFSGCTALTAVKAAGTVVTSTHPNGAVASTTTVGAHAVGATTITVATNGTAGFAPIHFWTNGTTSVSCLGFQEAGAVHQFTSCAWWGTAAATGTAPAAGHTITTQATAAADKGLIGGYIKIEKQNAAGVWSDVTMEILNLGIGAPNQEGIICQDPTPDAVLRIQRLRDNGGTPNTGVPATPCPAGYANTTNPYDYWPNALYDAREGNYRPGVATTTLMYVGGVMNYIALDVNNLRRWLAGTIPAVGATGALALNNNGYIVYFSDRRGDHSEAAGNPETGEYGSENFVNPTVSGGVPTVTCPVVAPQTGEDVNANGVLDCYGETPHPLGVQQVDFAGYGAPFNGASLPWLQIAAIQAQSPRMNRQVLFRRALKLVNANVVGGVTRLPADGLAVASENPVYVQGNYNATNDPVTNSTEPHVPAAIIADAVSVLSNNWTDARSIRFPNVAASRVATTTGYRFAVVTGKSLSFPYPSPGSPQFLFGTDGGAGNFLRMMEDWRPAGVDLNYRGSMVSLFISRQATGTFKYDGSTVYDYADRNFKFDSEFLQPALLPPGTPMFRDVNLLTFRQILRPNQ